MQHLYHKYNYFINSENPKETVISEDSYVQLNTKLTIENFAMLSNFRKTKNTLSKKKLNDLIKEYYDYQNNNIINEERIVYMTKEEILKMNN